MKEMNKELRTALSLVIEHIISETHRRRMLGEPIDLIKQDIIEYWLGGLA